MSKKLYLYFWKHCIPKWECYCTECIEGFKHFRRGASLQTVTDCFPIDFFPWMATSNLNLRIQWCDVEFLKESNIEWLLRLKSTVVDCHTNCCASKTNRAECAYCVDPSQRVDVGELGEEKLEGSEENNEMLQFQSPVPLIVFIDRLGKQHTEGWRMSEGRKRKTDAGWQARYSCFPQQGLES